MTKGWSMTGRHGVPVGKSGLGACCLVAWFLAVLVLCLAGCATWPLYQPYLEKPEERKRLTWLAHGLMGDELGEHDLVSLNFLSESGTVTAVTIRSRPNAPSSNTFDLWIHQYRDPGKIEHLSQHWYQRLASPYLWRTVGDPRAPS